MSRYVTSNSPLPVLDGGLSASGIRGTSNGGSCDKFPDAFTVVCSNVILMLEVPAYIKINKDKNSGDTSMKGKVRNAEKAVQGL